MTDAVEPRQHVDDVDGRVVAEIELIVRALRRRDDDHLQQSRGFLAYRQTLTGHLLGKLRLGERRAVLHVNGVNVGIGAERERDVERIAAIRAAGRLIIERVVDAVDLLLDWLRDRGLYDFGVCAGIVGRERHLRRYDVGELRNRYNKNSEKPRQRNDDRDDKGEARSIDENRGDHFASPTLAGMTVASTICPGRTFCTPSMITASPT